MGKRTILVVDDDRVIVHILQESILEINGNYHVKTCEDGKKALEILEKEKIDLLILEIQVPVINGLQVLEELKNRGIWIPIIIMTDSHINENDKKIKEFGIVDFVKKPFLPEDVVVRIDQMMKDRDKKDLIKNFSLPSVLQLIEMENRTGILRQKIGKEKGWVFFKEGSIYDIEVKGLSRDEALKHFINSLYEDCEISIEYIEHRKEKKINMSLMQIVMEATRLKDERTPSQESADIFLDDKETFKNKELSSITSLMDSLTEVESYVIADEHGELMVSSPQGEDEDFLNAYVYLWFIGEKNGEDFRMGEISNFSCHFKGKKRLIWKCNDMIIILKLKEIVRLSAFKEKLCLLFNQSSLEKGSGDF